MRREIRDFIVNFLRSGAKTTKEIQQALAESGIESAQDLHSGGSHRD